MRIQYHILLSVGIGDLRLSTLSLLFASRYEARPQRVRLTHLGSFLGRDYVINDDVFIYTARNQAVIELQEASYGTRVVTELRHGLEIAQATYDKFVVGA